MGSPDTAKVALGLLASTGALIISYIFVKKYGFRAYKSKTDVSECEELQGASKKRNVEVLKSQPEISGEEKEAQNIGHGDVEKTLDQVQKESIIGDIGADDGQNQTSFIVLGDHDGETTLDKDNGVKKSDRSSDESSYDVIEDDRLGDTIDDEENGKQEDGNVDDAQKEDILCVHEMSKGGESSLESSMVMVDAGVEGKSEPSFYVSADETFDAGNVEAHSGDVGAGDDDQPNKDLSEDEVTVMYKSHSTANDSISLEIRDNLDSDDVAQIHAERVCSESGTEDCTILQQDVSNTDEEVFSIVDAVQKADLEAASPVPEPEKEPESEDKFDAAQIAEMLNKSQNAPMTVTDEDIQLLVKVLRKNIPELQPTVLDCIVRIAAFNQNTTTLRESGCPEEIVSLVQQTCETVKQNITGAEETLTALNQVLTNLSLDPKAHPKLEMSIPSLIDILIDDNPAVSTDSLTLTILRPLVNLSGEIPYHHYYVCAVPTLLGLLDTGSHMAKIQALKVIVNLSLNADMVKHLLADQAPFSLHALLSIPTQSDIILRTVTALANIMATMKDGNITADDLPASRQGTETRFSLFTVLTETESLDELRSKVFRLTRDGDEDIRAQASRLYKYIPEVIN